MRISLLLSLFVLASCAQTFKRHPLKGTTYKRRYISCESLRTHMKDNKKVVSQLRYSYEAEEFRTEKQPDGSFAISYRVTYPGSKVETSSYHAGLTRHGALTDGKQWVENDWYRTNILLDETAAKKAVGKFTQRKALRAYSNEDDYVEVESSEIIDGKAVAVSELWSRNRETIGNNHFQEISKLTNPLEVEKDLLDWTVTCFDKWENLH